MKKLANLKGAKLLSKLEQKKLLGGDPIPSGPGSGGNGGGGNTGFPPGYGWPTNEEDCILCWGEWEGICALPYDSPCL